MPTAAIYCRISDDRAGDAAGVARQEKDCRRYCADRGWAVGAVFVDNDTSAFTGRRRPGYRAMLEAIKGGEVDAVVVWHLDRLHRRPIELEEFFVACDAAGVRELGTVFGDVNLATEDGKFYARMLGAVAAKESADKSRRLRRKHLELAEAGRAVGGGRPFGYEADRLTIRPAEAALITEAAERILAGETLRGICMDWSRRGIAPVKSPRWTQTALRRVLLSGRIAGVRTMGRGGPVVAKAAWPAIVDEVTHRRLTAVLTDPARSQNLGFRARTYLLSGFLFCGKCGTRMVSRATSGRRRTYVCSSGPTSGGCGGIRVVAAPLEAMVVRDTLELFDSKRFADAVAHRVGTTDDGGLAAEIATVERLLAEIADEWGRGVISRGEWQAARAPAQARLDELRARHVAVVRSDALSKLVGQGAALAGRWEDMTLDQRTAVLRPVIERITISPAVPGQNFFVPGRVKVDWRL